MNEKLKNEIARKLHKMEAELEDEERVRMRWQFVDKFIRCEVAVKKVMIAYREDKTGEKPKGFEQLNMHVIPAALAWAGFSFSKAELEELFSGSGRFKQRGSKSAKKLRDGALHEHNENDIQEIVDRYEELNNKMDAFLARFRWSEEELARKKKTAKKPDPAAPMG